MKSWMRIGVICLALISLEIVASQEEQLSDFLWQSTMSMHQAALGSPFIQGLKKVTLDPTNFGAFMVQDSVYCYKVKGSLDVAASRVTNNTSLKVFLQARSSSFEKYYQALFKSWHISNANGIQLGNACAGYSGHIQKVSEELDPLYLVAALIPCARLWPWLGGEINTKTGTFGVYTSWVKENLDPDYHGYKKYEDVINTAYKEGHINKNKALEVYTRSMRGEVEFFSSVCCKKFYSGKFEATDDHRSGRPKSGKEVMIGSSTRREKCEKEMINDLIQKNTKGSQLVIINLPPPPKVSDWEIKSLHYMEFLEVLTEGIDRVLMVRDSGSEVISIYS